MTDESKVTAVLNKAVSVIDGKTGDTRTVRTGVMKGFGKGFKNYVAKGNISAAPDVIVNTGRYPIGHEKEGEWAIQIMISPFEFKEDADTVADRMAANIRKLLNKAS